jgi:hypothetical protein
MDRALAEETSLLMLRLSARLNDQLVRIQSACPDEEFQRYRQGFGYVMGYMLTEILNPIYGEHPGLKPEGMGGSYQVPPLKGD